MKHLCVVVILISAIGLWGCTNSKSVPASTPEITHIPPTILATSTTTVTQVPTPTSTPTSAPTSTPTPETTEDKVRQQCREILQQYGATIDGIYAYINNRNPLQQLYYNAGDMPAGEIPEAAELAYHILESGKGVCYHFSALTYYLLQEAGFEAILITGARLTDGAPHRWTMVKTEKGWYHFDPQHHQKLLTDTQKQDSFYLGGNAMCWEESTYPRTPESL